MNPSPRTPRTQPQPPSPSQDRLGRIPLEPLPAEFEAELHELDELLAAQAASSPVPRYLADLVYDSTVGLLWPRESYRIEVFRTGIRRTVWGRLAMAASLGLAFVLAATTLREPASLDAAVVLSSNVEHLLLEPLAPHGFSIEYLLDTRDLTFDELSADMHRLLEQSEM